MDKNKLSAILGIVIIQFFLLLLSIMFLYENISVTYACLYVLFFASLGQMIYLEKYFEEYNKEFDYDSFSIPIKCPDCDSVHIKYNTEVINYGNTSEKITKYICASCGVVISKHITKTQVITGEK